MTCDIVPFCVKFIFHHLLLLRFRFHLVYPIGCSTSSTSMNHDYGRADGCCLLDQREFLAGEPPDQRVLEERVSAEGIACWQLKTW